MGRSASKQQDTAESVTFLLMGKFGNGKSSTGNSILNKKVFKASSKMTPTTIKVSSGYTRYKGYTLKVVDGPGLENTDDKVSDKVDACKNMDKALAMCSTGVDAFLLIIKFGNKFTVEEVRVLETLKGFFGLNYFNHVIVVVTYGDQFQSAMEDEKRSVNFDKWCREQTGEFSQLFKDCNGRVVLFNNMETDLKRKNAQRQHVIQLAYNLRSLYGRYTSRCFEIAKAELHNLIINKAAFILRDDIQKSMDLLTEDIRKFPTQPSDKDRENISNSVRFLKDEIKAQGKGRTLHDNVWELLEQINSNLHANAELQRLANILEETRRAEMYWGMMVRVSHFVNGKLSLIMTQQQDSSINAASTWQLLL